MATARVSKDVLEVLVLTSETNAKITQRAMEVLIPDISRSPTTVTGAGVTQDVLEVLIASGSTTARVSYVALEVLVLDTTQAGEVGTGPQQTRAFGYAI